ncbi:MAG: OmpA family protein, partial [Candidatus Kapaibacteriota bacterium]
NKIHNYNDFSYASLKNKSILDVYYNVLNIVGYRLRQHPNATITLIGCNSNVGEEMNNLELSYQRANSIAKYLISVWEIEPKRIRIEKQNLPSIFSNPKTPEGNSENQRVEIISDDPEILAPVSILDTSINISPQYLRIFAKFRNSSPKSYCKVLFLNTTDTLHKKLNHPLDSFDLLIYPRFKSNGISTSVFDINLEFSSNLDSGLIINKVISLPIQYFEKRAKSQKKEKIVLPPFYFNSSKINTKQIEFLNTYKEIILKAKNITLFGHTDIIGDREYNLQLSLSRGDSIEEYLINNYFSNIDHGTNEIDKKNYNCTINKKALGESNTPFDNSLPEGRFLS